MDPRALASMPWTRDRRPVDVGGCPNCRAVLHSVELPRHWLCSDCGRCWHFGQGGIVRTDPVACAGCDMQSNAACIETLTRDFWHFVLPPLE